MPGSPDRTSFTPGRVNVSPSDTQGGSRVPELGSLGSVRGALSNERPYRDLEPTTAESSLDGCNGFIRAGFTLLPDAPLPVLASLADAPSGRLASLAGARFATSGFLGGVGCLALLGIVGVLSLVRALAVVDTSRTMNRAPGSLRSSALSSDLTRALDRCR